MAVAGSGSVACRRGFAQLVAALALLAALPVHGQSAEAQRSQPVLSLDLGVDRHNVLAVAWTPDGREVLTAGGDGVVRALSAATGESLRLLRCPTDHGLRSGLLGLAVSPDGKWLAVCGEGAASRVRVFELATGRTAQVLEIPDSLTQCVAFSGDGRQLAAAGRGGTVRTWETQAWRLQHQVQVTDAQGVIVSLAFAPDGRRLAVGGWGGMYFGVLSLDTESFKAIDLADGCPFHVAWSPVGNRIACSMFERTSTVVVDAETGHVLLRYARAGATNAPAVFTATGDLWALDRRMMRRHLAADLTVTGRAVPATGYGVAVSPDGTRLAAVSDKGWCACYATADGTRLWSKSGTWGSQEVTLAIQGAGTALRLAGRLDYDAAGPAVRAASVGGEGWRGSVTHLASLTLGINSRAEAELTEDGRTLWRKPPEPNLGWNGGMTLLPGGQAALTIRDRVCLFDRGGGLIQTLVGSSWPAALAVTDDARYLAAVGVDQIARVWLLHGADSTTRPLLSLYSTPEGDWVSWTEEGYYACSPAAEKYIGWQLDHGDADPEFYRADQFRARFYRPDIIRRVLACGSVAQAVEQADAARHQATDRTLVVDTLATFAPPRVEILSPTQGAVVRDREVTVEARVHDPNGRKVASTLLLVNGRAPAAQRFVFVPSRGPEAYRGAVEVSPGHNVISLTATNDAGAQTAPVSIDVTYEAPDAELTKPALYLLAVGAGDYVRPEYRLALAGKDAGDFAAAYQAQQGRLFRRVSVKLLTDREASGGNVLDGLDWLSREVTQRDYAVVYLAGHGLPDAKGDFYFLPTDGDAERLLRTGIGWQQLRGVLKNLPGKVLLVLDTCHSGGAAGTAGARSPGRLDYTNALRDAATDEVGVITLASCMPGESSYERPEWGNGAFTKALVEALAGKGDLNGDGVVSVAELDAYVAERVKALTDGRQHPTTQRPTTLRSSLPLAATAP